MIDKDIYIAGQAIAKEIVQLNKNNEESKELFNFWMDLMELRATIPEEEEWVNTEIPISKEFWNQTPQDQTRWITEWGKPMPILNKAGRKEWYVHVRRKDMDKFKKIMSDFESSVNK